MLKILRKRGEIAHYEQFLLLSTVFCYLLLDFHIKTGTRFSPRDKRLFEITEVEITRVDCTYMYIIAQTKTTADIVFYDQVTLMVVTGKILTIGTPKLIARILKVGSCPYDDNLVQIFFWSFSV